MSTRDPVKQGLYASLAASEVRIAELEAQVAGLEQMNTEKAAEIRRLRMGGNHPAGRALPEYKAIALREAMEARDAEHEGGAGE